MFKERFFLFELGTTPSGSERPKVDVSEATTPRTEAANVSAEALVRNTASNIIIDLFGSNNETVKLQLGPNFTQFYESIQRNLSEGWIYKGVRALPEDMIILWEKPSGEQGEVNLSAYFTPEEHDVFIEMLSPENRAAMAKEKERARPVQFVTQYILPFLKRKRPRLKNSTFWESKLFKEDLFPVLEANFAANVSCKFRTTTDGFILERPGGVFPKNYTFILNEYDERLNYNETLAMDYAYEKQRKKIQQKIDRFINNNIIPVIKERLDIYDGDIFNSAMIKEDVGPILYDGYIDKNPFKITKTEKGFELSNSSDVHSFNFEDYDEKLNPYAPGVSPDEKPPAKTTDKVDDQKKSLDDSKTATDQLDDLPPDEKFEDNEDVYQETDEEREERVKQFIEEVTEERKTRVEAGKKEKKAIENATEDYYSDELESIREMDSNEILTNENIDDLEADMASLSENAGLSELHDLIVDFFNEVSQKIDSGEITTKYDFNVFENEYRQSNGIPELVELIFSEAETEEDLIYVKASIQILDKQYALMERFLVSELEDDGDEEIDTN